ncbi:MAG: helix-turn-helix domain-containing protein [Oscillospiraceae bacterium]|nr:helix-turn-helix domain-containing protein [Oscillospiraceae bacterium]
MTGFNTKIKNIRIQKKLTQKQLAELIGIAERHYQNYEYGTREPNLATFKRIAETINVSADYLLGLKEK